jgi:hypothetical protein
MSVVSSLVGDYFRQTELEKTEHGLAAYSIGEPLPDGYEVEIARPASAFAGSTVLIATWELNPAGLAVLNRCLSGQRLRGSG